MESDTSLISDHEATLRARLWPPISQVGRGRAPLAPDIKDPRRSWHASPTPDNNDNMTTLTAKDKDAVRAFWAKVGGKSDDIGTGALAR